MFPKNGLSPSPMTVLARQSRDSGGIAFLGVKMHQSCFRITLPIDGFPYYHLKDAPLSFMLPSNDFAFHASIDCPLECGSSPALLIASVGVRNLSPISLWYVLDGSSGTPRRFWQGVLTALQEHCCRMGAKACHAQVMHRLCTG